MKSARHGRDVRGEGPPEQVLFLDAELPAGSRCRLTGGEADHARRSLRLRTGDAVAVVNGRGTRARGAVVDLGRHAVEIELDAEEALLRWPRHEVTLAAGVLRSTRMDFLVEKASELGVARFVPLLLDRSVARPGATGTKEDRWHRLAVESLKQSRRSHLMRVEDPQGLEEFLGTLGPESALWLADPSGGAPPGAGEGVGRAALALVVGPEGGLADRERENLLSRGARPIRLGSHRLRAETAATVMVTAALLVLGEMGAVGSG